MRTTLPRTMRPLALCVTLGLLAAGCWADGSVVTKQIRTGQVRIEARGQEVHLSILKKDGKSLRSILSTEVEGAGGAGGAQLIRECGPSTTCVGSGNVTHTRITTEPGSETVQVARTTGAPSGRVGDCFELAAGTEWFGGPQHREQRWPVQNMSYSAVAYLPSHLMNMAVAERYWLSSQGFYVFADERSPLFLDQNHLRPGHLCLLAENRRPYRLERPELRLGYEIGALADPRLAHEHASARHFARPRARPSADVVARPIWSTWARYKVNADQAAVERFADEIAEHGFAGSQLEIDDRWESCYGSARFDPLRFPNVTGLLDRLRRRGLPATLWVHPFVNLNCREAYNLAKGRGYFVRNTNNVVLTKWWQGVGAALDFTNREAVEWFAGRLEALRTLGFASFKFDAGESSWLPQVSSLTGPLELQPALYTLSYTAGLAERFGSRVEVRTGWRSQALPVFVRMLDKDSTWAWDNGLPTLVTTLLQMNLNGYAFVLPDMIGGNGYVAGSFNSSLPPSKELFVRWLQASVFMPALQYSFVPWDYDDETVDICRRFTELHGQVAPTIVRLMEDTVRTGAPVNPPIWWLDPSNAQAHRVDDEFLLGEDVLVAPVVRENSTARDVYLPAGRWRDGNAEGTVYEGPRWLRAYPAPLHVLPYFHRLR